MGGPTAERVLYAPLPCLSARAQYASSHTRCEMTATSPERRPSVIRRELVHDLNRRTLARGSGSRAAGDGRKRNGGIARRAVGAARRRQLLRQRPTHAV